MHVFLFVGKDAPVELRRCMPDESWHKRSSAGTDGHRSARGVQCVLDHRREFAKCDAAAMPFGSKISAVHCFCPPARSLGIAKMCIAVHTRTEQLFQPNSLHLRIIHRAKFCFDFSAVPFIKGAASAEKSLDVLHSALSRSFYLRPFQKRRIAIYGALRKKAFYNRLPPSAKHKPGRMERSRKAKAKKTP